MNFRVIGKTGQTTYRNGTRLICDVNITTAYVSPKATADETLELLQPVEGHNNGKPVVDGDIKEEHTNWETRNNSSVRPRKSGPQGMGRTYRDLEIVPAQPSMPEAPRHIHSSGYEWEQLPMQRESGRES